MIKLISRTLFIVLLSQSCVVYQKTPVTLNEAVDKGRVKVILSDGNEIKAGNLRYDGGELAYHAGFEKSSGKKTPLYLKLPPESILAYPESKGGSTVATVLAIGGIALGAFLLGVIVVLIFPGPYGP